MRRLAAAKQANVQRFAVARYKSDAEKLTLCTRGGNLYSAEADRQSLRSILRLISGTSKLGLMQRDAAIDLVSEITGRSVKSLKLLWKRYAAAGLRAVDERIRTTRGNAHPSRRFEPPNPKTYVPIVRRFIDS